MDFLLECIGFPPSYPLGDLAHEICAHGEPVAWRGPDGVHLRMQLNDGLEVRLDREEGQDEWTMWPHYEVNNRLRVAVESVQNLPDSPFDALIYGRANPPLPGTQSFPGDPSETYSLATYVSDARRVPARLRQGHVLAVSIAGFALDITYIGPNDGVRRADILEAPAGAYLSPLGADNAPGGCMEVSLRVRSVRHIENPVTNERVEIVETDAPGRPLNLFLSRWQLESEGLATPRPGWRVEGAFLFTGRISGGLPPAKRRRAGH